MADISNQQILDWYNQHKDNADFGEQALKEMEFNGLSRERVNEALTPTALTPVWEGGGDGGGWVEKDTGLADRTKAWETIDQTQQQQTYNNFIAANTIDTNAATGRGTGTDVSQYTDRQQTLNEFLTENAAFINPDGTIKSAEQGGNYNYSGQKAIDVYNNVVNQKDKPAPASASYGDNWDPYTIPKQNAVSLAWIPGVENKGSFLQNLVKVVGTAVAIYYTAGAAAGWAGAGTAATAGGVGVGGAAGIGSGTVLGGGAAVGTASGFAGAMGMAPGLAATAVNAGALNTGVSLAMGKNIGDSLKSGVTAAALSGVGGWAKEGIQEATVGLGKTASSAIASVGSGAVTGVTGAAINGTDIGKGALTGMTTGAISEASKYIGGWAKQATGSADIGKAASTVSRTVLNGGNVGTGLVSAAVNQFSGDVGKTVGGGYTGALVSEYAKSALTGKKLNKRSLLTSLANIRSKNNRTNLNDNA